MARGEGEFARACTRREMPVMRARKPPAGRWGRSAPLRQEIAPRARQAGEDGAAEAAAAAATAAAAAAATPGRMMCSDVLELVRGLAGRTVRPARRADVARRARPSRGSRNAKRNWP